MVEPLLIGLFALALLYTGANGLALHLHGSRLLTPGFGVGKSMEPAIPRGLTAYVEHYPFTIEEGDVVTYEWNGMSICHRVIDVDGDEIRVKGDNNEYADGWFDKSEVTGKIWAPGGEVFWVPLSPTPMKEWVERRFR